MHTTCPHLIYFSLLFSRPGRHLLRNINKYRVVHHTNERLINILVLLHGDDEYYMVEHQFINSNQPAHTVWLNWNWIGHAPLHQHWPNSKWFIEKCPCFTKSIRFYMAANTPKKENNKKLSYNFIYKYATERCVKIHQTHTHTPTSTHFQLNVTTEDKDNFCVVIWRNNFGW